MVQYYFSLTISFTKIRVARKKSVSTTHCRPSDFDTANRIFGSGIRIMLGYLTIR
ncbi:hypothetical protein GCM10016272_25330 [Psychrobacter glaciei]|uniref:Uncharacterized protein n=1 Tax=Psychrobacter glaciei TaxID=619771 RepID=A0ABQ3GTY7_9GAMM|nr:hypothetical protein GCM10016272_25330 [Psychrobacter glaciei]